MGGNKIIFQVASVGWAFLPTEMGGTISGCLKGLLYQRLSALRWARMPSLRRF
ncbi:MAG: hypothetical protein IKI11_05010 [Neisseriaceae bacterium]|nr:hypothetical protein [Neisseriaceae bacterium]